MMKIVWLAPYPISDLPDVAVTRKVEGHASSWITNLLRELRKSGDLEIHLVTSSPYIPFDQEISTERVTFHLIKYNFPFTQRGFPSYLPLDRVTWYVPFVRKALDVINRIGPDLVHAHGTENAFALIGVKSRFKTVISVQGVIEEIVKVQRTVPELLQLPIERYSVAKGSLFGCRTGWDKAFIVRKNPAASIFYLPEAVNERFFETRWQENASNQILFVGYLSFRKGLEVLIKALGEVRKRVPTVHLKVIGSGTSLYQKKLNRLVATHGLEKHVKFLGSCGVERISEELSKAAVFVLPTLIDNSPNSLAEAMAVGVPCIASRVGGIPSMIEPGVNGLLVEPGAVTELSEKILMLLRDEELQRKLGNNAKATAFDRNYPSKVARITLDLYSTLRSMRAGMRSGAL